MIIFKVFERLLNIDDIDCKWGVRFMFLFCVVARCAVMFNPYSDTDFSWLNTWITTYESAKTPDQLPASLPITTGNIIFLVTAFLALFLALMGGILYSGLYVRYFRSKKKEKDTDGAGGSEEPIKLSALFKRFGLLTLFYLAVSVPFMLISSYFIVFLLIGFPFLFTAPACYLSGDKGMFSSIPCVVRLTRGFYLTHVRSLVLIVLVFFFTDGIAGLTSFVSNTAFYILSAAFSTWISFAFGRYAGMSYCAMKETKKHTEISPEKEGKIG
jgi:hypothetical protein